MEPGFDPYRELGLSPDASDEPELIRAAFKALAKKYHPDSYMDAAGKARAEEKMRRLNEAQRMILAGEYRPPILVATPAQPSMSAVAPLRSQGPEPAPAAELRRPARPAAKRDPKRPIPMTPMILAGLGLLLALVLPGAFRKDHLQLALSLENQGKLEQALHEADQAVAGDPRQGDPYLVRARLWQKLGKPDRAAVDLANARSLVSPARYEQARKELLPSPSPSPRASATPKVEG